VKLFYTLNRYTFGAFMKQLYYFYADAALIALRSIFAQKMRAFLTLIGIIIGVSSVVVVGASISGFNELHRQDGLPDPGCQSLHDGPVCPPGRVVG
jgi:hypothetical protein